MMAIPCRKARWSFLVTGTWIAALEVGVALTCCRAMAHDPDVYANPSAFDPDRFMGEQPEMDPRQFIFGFGRRVCPDSLLAQSSVFLTIARSLAVFQISKPVDGNGNAIEPNMRFEAGLVSHPAPFDAMINARSNEHVALIEEVEKTHPESGSSAKELEAITSW